MQYRLMIYGLIAGCLLGVGPAIGKTSRMSIQVRSAPLRAAPSYLSAVESYLAYGDRVSVDESRQAWRRVTHPDGRAGWLHESALTPKRVVLQADADATVSASSQEVALAGKGFNQQVEDEFNERHAAIDFTWVDRMERMVIAPDVITQFLTAGRDGRATE